MMVTNRMPTMMAPCKQHRERFGMATHNPVNTRQGLIKQWKPQTTTPDLDQGLLLCLRARPGLQLLSPPSPRPPREFMGCLSQ